MSKTEPAGYTCACGAEHEFSAWVFAHWRDVINHKCPACQRINKLLKGRMIK